MLNHRARANPRPPSHTYDRCSVGLRVTTAVLGDVSGGDHGAHPRYDGRDTVGVSDSVPEAAESRGDELGRYCISASALQPRSYKRWYKVSIQRARPFTMVRDGTHTVDIPYDFTQI